MCPRSRLRSDRRPIGRPDNPTCSILELIGQPHGASGIVLGRRSLRGRAAVSQSSLEFQMLGEVDVNFDLAEAGGALPGTDEYPTRDVAARLEARAGALSRRSRRTIATD